MKIPGLILGVLLVLGIFASVLSAEAKAGQATGKKDIKELKVPESDRSVKITSVKKSRSLSVLHIVGVEVCAGRDKLYSPELDMRSDRESITVKVSGLIMPKMCKNAEFFIRANDPETISVSFSKPVYYLPRA